MPSFCHLIFLRSLAKPPCVSTSKAVCKFPDFGSLGPLTEAVLSSDGQFAYLLGNNAVTMDDPTGEPVTTKGRAVTIWQRGTDGEWRCAVDIWNAEPTAGRTR